MGGDTTLTPRAIERFLAYHLEGGGVETLDMLADQITERRTDWGGMAILGDSERRVLANGC